jgi:hypothetical protein
MNELIQKLAEESGLDVKTMGFENNQYQHDPWNARLSKFTQLIVKECCNAADDWYKNHNNIHWDPAQHIRNHLGLEE